MACKNVRNFLSGANYLYKQNNRMLTRIMFCHSNVEESSETEEEEILPSEWYELAFSKMNKWSHSLKELDLIGGRLVNINDHSRVFNDKLEKKMQTFKSTSRAFIGLPSTKETMQNNLISSSSSTNSEFTEFHHFCKPHERDALTVNSLTKISDILTISAQQRKVVRQKICPQVTQYNIWTGALTQILNGLNSEIESLISTSPSKETRLAQQVIVNCLDFLQSATSYDPNTSSWMRITPTKGVESSNSLKWEDALEMWTDLINCLSDESDLSFHVSKLGVMKEGLYQIRDVLVDKRIGYKENRYQEYLVQKKLSKTLGHSSKCLFTLLVHYLYGSVGDIEVEVRGGVYGNNKGNKYCLYMGKILTMDEEKVVWNGVKELDKAMGVFKFVWESAGMKGDLVLQGHLWCVGAKNRSFRYRGNVYLVHEISL